jgi:leucyl-tRNA synthetase
VEIMAYNYKEIEKKWQHKWDKEHTFCAKDDFTLPKWYGLIEFPYPSAQGLHVGHPRSYTAIDIIARKKRMEGFNVLYPIGFDAFGLPAENYAIKTKIHPKVITAKNVENFTKQLKSFGFSFDWERCVDTTDPDYYKWTQWIFIQLFKKGLAYKSTMPINFCTSCKVGLANEEVVGGKCERCRRRSCSKRKKSMDA